MILTYLLFLNIIIAANMSFMKSWTQNYGSKMKCINDFIYELLIISSNERKYKCYDTFVIYFHNLKFNKYRRKKTYARALSPGKGERERERESRLQFNSCIRNAGIYKFYLIKL